MRKLRKTARRVGRVFLVLLLFVITAYIFIYMSTERRINTKYRFSEQEIAVSGDSLSIAKGRHLYQIRSCSDCHGAKLEGSVFMNDPMLMRITAPNLTKGRGALPADYSTADWLRVLRHGVAKDGRSLWMMPAHESAGLSREDLAALIAYCQSMPPVDNKGETLHKIGLLGRVVMLLNKVAVLPAERINHSATIAATTPKGQMAYGKYLVTVCQGCHRPDMKGGSPLAPGFPPVPDISETGAQGTWTDAQFISTIRNGETPDGRALRDAYMPWKNMKHFSDDELRAIHSYLQSLK